MKLSLSELRYLETVVSHHIESGSYWGDRLRFIKRQDRVMDWINHQIAALEAKPRGEG